MNGVALPGRVGREEVGKCRRDWFSEDASVTLIPAMSLGTSGLSKRLNGWVEGIASLARRMAVPFELRSPDIP